MARIETLRLAGGGGELVTGDHIVSTSDNMLGIDGGKDTLVTMDAYSGLKSAYPMSDKSAESTMMAIKLFKGHSEISRFCQTAPARSNVHVG
ncbi:MAG: hypothetical protein ACKPKO_18295 [Candidatus Fonsibacter sp.]